MEIITEEKQAEKLPKVRLTTHKFEIFERVNGRVTYRGKGSSTRRRFNAR